MPFLEFHPRTFSAFSVSAHAPAQSGVYGISNASKWIYIGSADNIRDALMGHLQQTDPSILKQHPTGFVFELCDRGQRPQRQDRLIQEYEPICNRHWSAHGKV